MEITKDQLKTILKNAPKGSDPKKVIKALQAKGHTIQGLVTAKDMPAVSTALNIADKAGIPIEMAGKAEPKTPALDMVKKMAAPAIDSIQDEQVKQVAPTTSIVSEQIEGAQKATQLAESEEVLKQEISQERADFGAKEEAMGFLEKLKTSLSRGSEEGSMLEDEEYRALKNAVAKADDPVERAYLQKSLDKWKPSKLKPVMGAFSEVVGTLGEGAFDLLKQIPLPVGMPTDDPEEGINFFMTAPEIYDSIKEEVPEPARDFVANQLANTATWFNGLPLERQQQLRETGFLGEFITSALGGAATTKLLKKPIQKGIQKGFSKMVPGETVKTSKKLGKIEEMIQPKLTSKEMQKIVTQGRVEKGKEGIFFGKRPDIIQQSKELKEAANTIATKIPKADKMDEFALVKAIDEEIGKTSNMLKPEMEKIKVTPDKAKEALEEWAKLKRSQSKDTPEFDAFAGSKKAQTIFEGYMKKLNKPFKRKDGTFRPRNLNDVWNIRKEYDDIISETVKTAGPTSAPSTLLQQEMWLENRRILNNIINDMSNGLGDTSRNAFKEMSDLYMAKGNIAKKVKIDTKGKSGFFTKKKVLGAALGAVAVPFGASAID